MKKLSFLILPLAVAGCGGGSGGPGGPDGTSFMNLSNLEPGETVTVHASTRSASLTGTDETDKNEFSFSLTADASGKVKVKDGDFPAGTGISAPDLEMALNQSISADDINIPEYDLDISKPQGGKFIVLETTANDMKVRVSIASPEENRFEYQTFSTWMTRGETTSGVDGGVGAASIGVETAAADIPSSGTATFKGKAMGEYVANATSNLMISDATLNADFANSSATFRTANTRSQGGASMGDLDLNGTMSYAPGTNGMSGTVSTAGGMNGEVDGHFYGPNAQEVGGTFSARGDGDERYYGGYGANKQ